MDSEVEFIPGSPQSSSKVGPAHRRDRLRSAKTKELSSDSEPVSAIESNIIMSSVGKLSSDIPIFDGDTAQFPAWFVKVKNGLNTIDLWYDIDITAKDLKKLHDDPETKSDSERHSPILLGKFLMILQ